MRCIKRIRVTIKLDVVKYELICGGQVNFIKDIPYQPDVHYMTEAKKLVKKHGADNWYYGGH